MGSVAQAVSAQAPFEIQDSGCEIATCAVWMTSRRSGLGVEGEKGYDGEVRMELGTRLRGDFDLL